MAAIRVQYALERTLPSLELLAQLGLFSTAELRALTHRRSRCEAALVRRNVARADFAAYLALEAQFDELLALRVERLPEQLPPATSAKLRAESARRSIAIYERGVIRLRGDVDFWLAYLAWARGRGMRVVAGRVAARALALFPNEHRLWIGCADDELRKSGIASARALLQRAIRLNTVPHERSAKRRRGEEGIAAPLVEPPTLRLSPKEMNLVALWVAYVRMELVFLERLRRRKAVLGLDGKDAAAKKELETAVTEEEVDEEEAAVLADVEAPTEPAPAAEAEVEASEATAQIVNGAIPLSLLSSSLASTSSLPPRTHYLFLLAFVALIRQFPFLPSPASDPKSALLAALNDALHARFEHPSSALLVASAPLLAAASPDPISDAAEELSEGTALASASTLHVSPPELQTLLEALPEGDESAQPLALAHELIVRAFSASADPHAVRSTLDALRLRLRSAPSPSLSGACVRLVCALRAAAEEPPMQAYLSGVARRIVSDARAQGHDAAVAAPALKLALEALSAQDGSKEEWKALHKEAMRACTRDADAETRLTRIAVREGLARARSEGKEVLEKEWSAVLALPGHEAEMWDAWTRWVSLEALDDAKWARNLLEASITATISKPAQHESVLLCYLRLAPRPLPKLLARIYAARPSGAVLAAAIDLVRTSDTIGAINADKVAQLEQLHLKLAATSREGVLARLRFVMQEMEQPQEALRLLRNALREMSEADARWLETEWERVCAEDAEESESEESDEEEDEADSEDM